jgi:peroxiredoxin Q/BCP
MNAFEAERPRAGPQTGKEISMNLLEVGAKAPDFNTTDQNGNKVALKDYRGKRVVLYFYPKDNTPGCTKEACAFRDHFAEFRKLGVEVLGVSVDTEKSHKSFAEKFKLPFTLLADTDRKIVTAYGVWGEKSLYGRKYMGTNRVTYLIGAAGRIAAVFPKVKPPEHAAEILARVSQT